jgi:hypothetical protein
LTDDPFPRVSLPRGLLDEVQDGFFGPRGPEDFDIFDRWDVTTGRKFRINRRAVQVHMGIDEARKNDASL